MRTIMAIHPDRMEISVIESPSNGKIIPRSSRSVVIPGCTASRNHIVASMPKRIPTHEKKIGSPAVIIYDFFDESPKRATILKICFLSRKYHPSKKAKNIPIITIIKSPLIATIVPARYIFVLVAAI